MGNRYRGIAQLVEQWSPKPRAEGSNPSAPARYADVAQVVAHILGKDEVTSSSLVISSKKMSMNGLFKLFMDIFVLFEKISALESESNAHSTTLTLCFLRKVARLNATHTLIRGIGEGVLSQRISYENIGQLRKFLLERSLFDNKRFGNKLFQSDTILTFTSISRRFYLPAKKYRRKCKVLASFIKKRKCKALIKCTLFSVIPRKTPVIPRKTPRIPRIIP